MLITVVTQVTQNIPHNSASLLSPYKSCSSLHLWNDAPIFILVFSLARSNSFFLHCFSLSVFLILLFEVGNGGAFYGSVVLLSVLCHWLQFGHENRGTVEYAQREVGGLLTACAREWLTFLRHSPWLWLVGAVDSWKSNYSHLVETQTVDFYTADQYQILLSDHNDNLSKFNFK